MNEKLKKMLTSDETSTLLFRFAYIGKKEEQIKYLAELANLAEKEIWTSPDGKDYDILLNYLQYTFDKAAKDDLVYFTPNDDYAAFNTGLLTENGEDIICMFNKFTGSQKFAMHLYGFKKESDYEFLNNFAETPPVVTYFDNPEKIYFDPNKKVVKNLDHILQDHTDRFSDELKNKGKLYISALLSSALDLTLKRCKRNYRIAVPQYYNDEITYLLPVNLDGHKMALAVGYVNNRYRVNTICTLSMAYKNARLLMKPEADWLALE